MSPIKAILWDIGGTLLIDGLKPAQSVRSRLARAGLDHSSLSDEYIESTVNTFLKNERTWRTLDDEYRDQHSYAKILLQKLGQPLDESVIENLAQQLKQYYDVLSPVPGIYELLDKLQQQGIRQAVVSNWPPSLPLVLKHFQMDHYFDFVIYSAEDGVHKPECGIFNRAMSRLNLQPRECLFIGDNPEWDIIPTRAMGMAAIHFDPRKRYAGREATTVTELQDQLFRYFE